MCPAAYPFAAPLRQGARVLDVGCGAGADALLAAARVGGAGRVTGVDITEELVRVARSAAKRAGRDAVTFERGDAEALPFQPGAFDVVLANGVINAFAVDKTRALREAARVLAPGGELVLADRVAEVPAGDGDRATPARWAGGSVGLVPLEELRGAVEEAGFAVTRTGHAGAAALIHARLPAAGGR